MGRTLQNANSMRLGGVRSRVQYRKSYYPILFVNTHDMPDFAYSPYLVKRAWGWDCEGWRKFLEGLHATLDLPLVPMVNNPSEDPEQCGLLVERHSGMICLDVCYGMMCLRTCHTLASGIVFRQLFVACCCEISSFSVIRS